MTFLQYNNYHFVHGVRLNSFIHTHGHYLFAVSAAMGLGSVESFNRFARHRVAVVGAASAIGGGGQSLFRSLNSVLSYSGIGTILNSINRIGHTHTIRIIKRPVILLLLLLFFFSYEQSFVFTCIA